MITIEFHPQFLASTVYRLKVFSLNQADFILLYDRSTFNFTRGRVDSSTLYLKITINNIINKRIEVSK